MSKNAHLKLKLEKQHVPTLANKKEEKGNKMTLVHTTHQQRKKKGGANHEGGPRVNPLAHLKPSLKTFDVIPICTYPYLKPFNMYVCMYVFTFKPWRKKNRNVGI